MHHPLFDEVVHSAAQLFDEVTAQNLVKTTMRRVRIPSEYVSSLRQFRSLVPLFKKLRQVGKLTVLHDHVEVVVVLVSHEQRNDVRMMDLLQHRNLGIKIRQELLTQLFPLDGLDCGVGLLLPMLCQVDVSEAALSDLVLADEVAHNVIRRSIRIRCPSWLPPRGRCRARSRHAGRLCSIDLGQGPSLSMCLSINAKVWLSRPHIGTP